MFRENDELFPFTVGSNDILIFLQQTRQFVPLSVLTAGTNLTRHFRKTMKRPYLFLHFSNSLRCAGSRHHLILCLFNLTAWRIIKILGSHISLKIKPEFTGATLQLFFLQQMF